jgi:sRNA-binding carbon storage regulator CsrA
VPVFEAMFCQPHVARLYGVKNMDSNQYTHLTQLREAYKKRLQEINIKIAKMGIDSPVHILIERDEINQEIVNIDFQLLSYNNTVDENFPKETSRVYPLVRKVSRVANIEYNYIKIKNENTLNVPKVEYQIKDLIDIQQDNLDESEVINIILVSEQTGVKTKIVVPYNMKIWFLIKLIRERLGLPQISEFFFESQLSFTYNIMKQKNRKILDKTRSIKQERIRNNDEIYLQATVIIISRDSPPRQIHTTMYSKRG